MPEYLTPGVYIEEIERGPRPIEGVPTSTAAFLGETERGPLRPKLVTSFKDYQRWFGNVFADGRYMPYAVNGFFENGGKRLYVSRIVGENATICVEGLRRLQGGSSRSRRVGPKGLGQDPGRLDEGREGSKRLSFETRVLGADQRQLGTVRSVRREEQEREATAAVPGGF